MSALLFGSSGAAEMSVFHTLLAGNGTNPLRLPRFPRVMFPQLGAAPGTVTAMVADAVFVVSAVEVAVMVAVSAPELGGVNVTAVPELTPVEVLRLPPAVGLIERFTVFVNAPVPLTVGVQVAVCAVVMEEGVHTRLTPVTAGGAVLTAILAVPEIFRKPNTDELAVQVALPEAEGVKTPLELMVPPVADHVTALLKSPVPETVAPQVVV
jgi:hypothetical protein